MVKQRTRQDSLIRMVIALTLITSISALILSWVHEQTKVPIEQAQNNEELKAIEAVIGNDFDNNPYQDRMKIPTSHGKDKLDLYIGRKDNKIKAIAIKTYSNQAFGGRLELIVGFNILGQIKTYKILKSNETPGLGSKVSEEKFKSQFSGLKPRTSSFRLTKDGGDIDGVTAATISSRAVINAINRAYKAYQRFRSGGKYE